jgi:hypothetical protein
MAVWGSNVAVRVLSTLILRTVRPARLAREEGEQAGGDREPEADLAGEDQDHAFEPDQPEYGPAPLRRAERRH